MDKFGYEYKRKYYIKNKSKMKKKQSIWKKKAKLANPIKFRLDVFHRRARHRGLDCDLDTSWCDKVYTGLCSISKLPFVLSANYLNIYSPSVDRIDNSKGYTKDNCRIILNGINYLKGVATYEDVYLISYGIWKNLNKTEKLRIKTKYKSLTRPK